MERNRRSRSWGSKEFIPKKKEPKKTSRQIYNKTYYDKMVELGERKTSEKIMAYHLESSGDLDDIMETLDDYGLLNDEGKIVRKEIWEATWEGKPDFDDYEDRMLHAWNSFSEDTQKSLLKEYESGGLNSRAKKFVKKFLPN